MFHRAELAWLVYGFESHADLVIFWLRQFDLNSLSECIPSENPFAHSEVLVRRIRVETRAVRALVYWLPRGLK